MWIVIAVIVVFFFARALNNAGRRENNPWSKENEQAYWDEELED